MKPLNLFTVSLKSDKTIKRLLTPVIAGILIMPSVLHAADVDRPTEWKQQISIYGWFPSIDGTLKYAIPGTGDSAEADASDLIDNLQDVFMGE